MATSAASYFLLKSAGSSVSGSSFLISQERSVFDLELPCTLMPWCDWHPDVLLAPVAAGRSGCAVSLGEPATATASVSFSESYREASEFARCSTCSRCTDWFTNRSTLILKKQHKTTQNNILHCWASFATRSELYTLIVMLMRFDVQSQIINLPWGLDIH